MCCIERPAFFLSPSDALHGGLGVLQKNDILILISKGGHTAELEPLSFICNEKKAYLIVVSENDSSIISKNADLFLRVKVESEPCKYNMLATASTLVVIATFDAICIALMEITNYSKKQFALIHPNGMIGEKLSETI